MRRFEYRFAMWGAGTRSGPPDLNELGAIGWEVLTFHVIDWPTHAGSTPDQRFMCFMKREIV
jgi:hypothetical protein